jgi:hypothetical protein
MAIKKVIEIDVDQVQAMGGLSALQQSLGEVEKKTSSLKTEYRKAQQEVARLSDEFGATSKQAIEAAKRAGELGDKIADAKALTDAFNPDAKFKAVSASLTGVASGFSAYQGALGLVGKESKNLEAQLLKVQSAMALAQGLQGLGEAKDSFIQLKAVAINAFEGIKRAIGATGIGLLVVALGTVYAYWDDIKEAVSGVSEEQKKLNVDSKKNLDQEQEKLKTIGDQDEVLKLQGKSEREILKIKLAQTNEAIIASEINLENIKTTNKEQQKAVEQNYKYLKSFIDFISIPQRFLYENGAKAINALIGLINKIPGVNIDARLDENFANDASDYVAKLIFDPTEVKAEGEKTVKEAETTLMNLKNQRAGFQNQINAIDTKASDDRIKTAEEEAKALALLLKAQADANANAKKEVTDAIEQAQEKNNEFLLSSSDAEIQKVNDKYFKLIEMAKQFNLDTVELETAKANEINEINLKTQEQEQKARDDAKLADEKRAEEKKILREQEIQATSQMFGILSDLLGRSSKAGKAFAIAQSLINTYQGITAGVKLGYPAAIPAVAMATITGFSAVKKIISTNPKSGGSSSVSTSMGGGGGGESATPQFNLVGQSSTNQLNATIAGQQNRPVQTFVVGSQVSTQQALDRNAVANSVFG